ncbi:MAG: septation protein IspZ, partial [Mariprofundaceae bacterium]
MRYLPNTRSTGNGSKAIPDTRKMNVPMSLPGAVFRRRNKHAFTTAMQYDGIRPMKFLFDFFPVLFFFIAYKMHDIYVATAVLIVACFVQTA